ncbi:class I SAM-dependent methyltransferase [Streptomyces sp. NPDC058812]|uniref:class I SAM-dependent methyltransferase n=1 Tax=unclassified Streptomyces TaxID=2593676 RepID=UPI00369933F6
MTTSRPIFGRLYPRMNRAMQKAGISVHRERLLAGLTGRVIEIGAGDGASFPFYPADVTHLSAVEPEPHLRKHAESATEGAKIPTEVVDAAADHLPFPDAHFDAAVVSLVLCSVQEQTEALNEIMRVLRPGGQLRFFEHVRAESPGLRRAQRVLDATVGPTLCGGCHSGRDTLSAITRTGFRIEQFERFRFPETPVPMPASQHVLGTAVAPA